MADGINYHAEVDRLARRLRGHRFVGGVADEFCDWRSLPSRAEAEEMGSFQIVSTQDRWWKDRAGRLHLVDHMEPSYRDNLIRFLERNWEASCVAAEARLLRLAGDAADDYGMACLDLESAARVAGDAAGRLAEMALYRRLVALRAEELGSVAVPTGVHVHEGEGW